MMFAQAAEPIPETDGVTHASIAYFGCNGSGHYHNQCPVQDRVQMIQCFGNEDRLDAAYERDNEYAGEISIPLEDKVYGEELDGREDTRGEDADEDDVFIESSFVQDHKDTKRANIIKHSLILLHSEFTVCTFCNKDLFEERRPQSRW